MDERTDERVREWKRVDERVDDEKIAEEYLHDIPRQIIVIQLF